MNVCGSDPSTYAYASPATVSPAAIEPSGFDFSDLPENAFITRAWLRLRSRVNDETKIGYWNFMVYDFFLNGTLAMTLPLPQLTTVTETITTPVTIQKTAAQYRAMLDAAAYKFVRWNFQRSPVSGSAAYAYTSAIVLEYETPDSGVNTLYMGGAPVDGLYLGSAKVDKVYLGTTLVYNTAEEAQTIPGTPAAMGIGFSLPEETTEEEIILGIQSVREIPLEELLAEGAVDRQYCLDNAITELPPGYEYILNPNP